MQLATALIPLLCSLTVVVCENKTFDEKDLAKLLLSKYSAAGVEGRPLVGFDKPIPVQISFSLIQIIEFDQVNQAITVVGRPIVKWTDELLEWFASDHGGVDSVAFRPDAIWKPDIALVNAVARPEVLHDSFIRVNKDGEALWISAYKYKLFCVTDPDQTEPTCDLKFGSWTMNTKMMALKSQADQIDANQYVPHHAWELGGSTVKHDQSFYQCCPDETFSQVTFSFTLNKRIVEVVEEDNNSGGASLRFALPLVWGFLLSGKLFDIY